MRLLARASRSAVLVLGLTLLLGACKEPAPRFILEAGLVREAGAADLLLPGDGGWDGDLLRPDLSPLGPQCELPADKQAGLRTPARYWEDLPSPVIGGISEVSATGFSFSYAAQAIPVSYRARDVPLPFSAGQVVTITHCSQTADVLDEPQEVLVIHDQTGRLLLAGGSGGYTLAATCLPPDFIVTRAPSSCEAVALDEVLWPGACGARANFPLRFHASSTVTIWSGQTGWLQATNARYYVENSYSFDASEWQARCNDAANYYAAFIAIAQ